MCPPRSLANPQTAIPSCFRCRSFHHDAKATEATRPEAQAMWLPCSASCLCHTPSGPRSDAKGSGDRPGHVSETATRIYPEIDLIASARSPPA